jgi:diguanylate cyclase (GGDEF)-like protein/PAS domain S-box-containing protein
MAISKAGPARTPVLIEDEQRLRLVVEAAPNAMLMVDARGHITLVNSQAEQLFGYRREELLDQPVEMLVPRRARNQHQSCREGFLAAPDTRPMGAGRDLYGVRKDGREVPIEIGLNPLRMPEGLYVLASIIDISERKRAEQRLRLVIEAAPNAMLMVNRQGRIVLVNSQAVKLFGYPRGELLSLPIEALIPERFRARHQGYRDGFFSRPDARAMGAGRDLYGVRRDGSEVPIEIGLNPLETEEGRFVLASVIDITERKATEKLVRSAHAAQLRETIIDSLPFSIIATNTQGVVLAANPAAERLTGYGKQELVGKSSLLMHDPGELRRRSTELSQELGRPIPPDFQVIVASGSQGVADEREWTYIRRDGSVLPVNVAITAMRDESGRVSGFLKVAYDITERKRSEAFIRHLAHHDALTGLPNRALLLDRLGMAVHQVHRHGGSGAVLLLDLDHFKRVNDSLGHQTGDVLLLNVARRLQSGLRDSDTVARLGGDEFVLLLPEVASREALAPVIEKLVAGISAPISIEGRELVVTPSIGGCLFPADGEDPSELLRCADTAMYQAKAAGRSNVQWFAPAMLELAEERLALSAALRRAIDADELGVHYQPEIGLRDGRVVGMEALVRWNGARCGPISPERFIPVAEETGLVLPLGEWVLRKACGECARLSHALGRELVLAVNVSPRQFQQPGWPQIVARALADGGLPARCLELEITEGMLMQNPDDNARRLHALRELGVSVVVDDFGTGYSSLSYLTRFPIDKIKIDRSFVRGLASDAADAAIVNAIIAMAHSLGLRVVAEGVETEQQRRYLQQRGCDEAQGFHYGPGVEIGQFGALLEKIEAAAP